MCGWPPSGRFAVGECQAGRCRQEWESDRSAVIRALGVAIRYLRAMAPAEAVREARLRPEHHPAPVRRSRFV